VDEEIVAGGNVQVQQNWVSTGGDFEVSAIADVTDLIPEGGEENNDHSENFTVIVDYPDYWVSDIRYDSDGNGWGHKAVIHNSGGGSVLSTTVGWYIDGSYVTATTIGGVGSGDSTTTMIPFQSGDSIRVVCDYGSAVDESNEDNNQRFGVLPRPDLVVTDIQWTPEVPEVGETVTFYAQVENIGLGGDEVSYSVSFVLDDTLHLGYASVTDDIALGQIADAFNNAGFELGDFTNWSSTSNFELHGRTSDRDGYYVSSKAYSPYTGTMRSSDFEVTDSVIVFSMRELSVNTDDAGMRLRRVSDDVVLKQQEVEDTQWRSYVWDVQYYQGQQVYVEIYDNDGTSNDGVMVDNIRMGSDAASHLVVSVPTRNWTATAGAHTITAIVDVNDDITESGEENNNVGKKPGDRSS